MSLLLYARNPAGITSQCSLQIRKTSDVNLPTQISPDVWILMTPVSTPASTITLICPERGYRNHHHKKTCTHSENTYSLQHHFTKLSTYHLDIRLSNFNVNLAWNLALDINVSLNMANLHMVNASALDFHIWQHLGDNRSETQLQHLTTIPSIPVHKIYQHMINGTQHIMPFDTTN